MSETPSNQMSDLKFKTKKDTVATILGWVTLVLFMAGTYFAIVSPPDKNQGDLVRIMYVHVPTAWVAYLAFAGTAFFSLMYLIQKNRRFDRLAAACSEIGLILMSLTLLGGMLWAKPTFGAYWTWEPKETTTAILLLIYVGYFIVRGMIDDPHRRARVAGVVGVAASLSVPLNYMSTGWWKSLHQGYTVNILGKTSLSADPRMLEALFINLIAFTVLFVYLLRLRGKLAARLERQEDRELEREFQMSQQTSQDTVKGSA